MNAWKTWNLQAWNDRLLDHFFRITDEFRSPVVSLLVTADELARASRDVDAKLKAKECRDAFRAAVRTGICRSKSLLEDASDYHGWPGPPRWDAPPRFAAHLLFTCIAASESDDELGDERSFVFRLRELTQDQLPEQSLQKLPLLWENLAIWLKRNSSRFRPLILPNPGGYTRIGYTVKLAFPDRRDQYQLSDLLDGAGLAGHEPPVGRVLSLVASERSRFRRSFLEAFDDFRGLFESSEAHAASRLVEHRFWAAVREAALRGRGQEGSSDVAVRLSLLGEEEDGHLDFFAVAEEATEVACISFATLPVSYGPWRCALIPKGVAEPDEDQLERIVSSVLDGSLRLRPISNYVDQGLLPFVAAPHGLLELATQDQLGEVSVALVRKDLAADLVRVLGNRAHSTPHTHKGWVELRDPRLRKLQAEEIEGTSLGRTWILQQTLNPATCRFVGGIRADDGWMGVREVLPRVVAPGALEIAVVGPQGTIELSRLNDTVWCFPPKDLAGEYTIGVTPEGQAGRGVVRFYAAPACESFKPASDPAAWIVEEVAGTGTLAGSPPFAASIGDLDCAPLCERTALLGRDVGVFAPSPEQAAWRIAHFAGTLWGTRAALRGNDAIPSGRVASPHARQRWRKILFESVPDGRDPTFKEARGKVRAGTAGHARLPTIDLDQSVPDLAPLRLASPSDATDRLARIISGRAASRAGIDWIEWAELTRHVLDVDEARLQHVTRAWMEAGLIDVASSARWWHRSVFARLPRLVGFQVGECFGAALSGLALSTTIEELRRGARRMGVLVEDRLSVSTLVPGTVSLRAYDRQALEGLASSCHLELVWLDLASLEHADSSRHDGRSDPPEHYERKTRWWRWSLTSEEHSAVSVEHHMRRDRPDFWLTSRDDLRVWFYDLNLARAWAAAMLGEPLVVTIGNTFLEAKHAYLPLPLARALSVLGDGLPGPVDTTYRYAVRRPALREFALKIVSQTFNPSRLLVRAIEQATG